MPAPTVCSVTGTCRDSSGSALQGVIIRASAIRPFIHSTDSSLITNYEVSTTSASNGTWSLSLVETATDSVTMTITFIYPASSSASSARKEYTITVPNSASATFASLVSGQV